jgi:hypothetical protein
VLSEATAGDGAGSKDAGLIDQVTRRQGQDGGLARGSTDHRNKDTGSQQHSSEVDTRCFSGFRCINTGKFS